MTMECYADDADLDYDVASCQRLSLSEINALCNHAGRLAEAVAMLIQVYGDDMGEDMVELLDGEVRAVGCIWSKLDCKTTLN